MLEEHGIQFLVGIFWIFILNTSIKDEGTFKILKITNQML